MNALIYVWTLLICILLLPFPLVTWADEILFVPKRYFNEKEINVLCGFQSEPDRQDRLTILNSPETPQDPRCLWGTIESLAWNCRVMKNEDDFLGCVDKLLPYVQEFPPPKSPARIFFVGDLLVKQSRLYEKRGDFILAAKAFENLHVFDNKETLTSSIVDEVSRLYKLGKQYKQAETLLLNWLDTLESKILSDPDSSEFDMSYIQVYKRLIEINVELDSYFNAANYLQKFNIYLLKQKDCWTVGWYELIRLREELERKVSGERVTDYSDIKAAYLRLDNAFDEIWSSTDKTKAVSMLRNLESDVIVISFVCPWAIDNFNYMLEGSSGSE